MSIQTPFFSNQSLLGAIFAQIFREFVKEFFPDFVEFWPDFHQIKTFGGAVAAPAPSPPTPVTRCTTCKKKRRICCTSRVTVLVTPGSCELENQFKPEFVAGDRLIHPKPHCSLMGILQTSEKYAHQWWTSGWGLLKFISCLFWIFFRYSGVVHFQTHTA